jgi:putative Holliday junction resolvase
MPHEPGRVMALSDTTRVLASPLTTVRAEPRARALAELSKLVRDYEVAELVVGLPLTLSGEVGPQAMLVRVFAEQLQSALGIPMQLFDERLTTVAAERMMIDLGMKPEQRKARIDEVAASIILQDFLDSIRDRS